MVLKNLFICLCFILISTFLFSNGNEESQNELHRIDIMWWGDIERHERTLRILNRYEEENQSIVFNPVYSTWQTYWDRLYSLIAADEAPDIFQNVVERLPLFSEKELLLDLYGIDSLDLGGIDKELLFEAEISGELMGLPLGINALALAYNPSIFDNIDLAYPNDSWTWDDLLEKGMEVAEKSGIYGVETFSSNNFFFYYIRSKGLNVYNENLNGPGWDKDVAEEWFSIILDFQDSAIIPPPDKWINNQASEENSLFAKEKAAMKIMWSNRIVSVSDKMQKPCKLALPPGPGVGYGLSLRPSLLFSLYQDTKVDHYDLGDFLNYFIYDLDVNRLQNNDRGIPVVKSVRHTLKETADIQNLIIYEYIDKVTGIIQPVNTGYPLKEGEFREYYDEIIRLVRFRKVTPGEGAALLWEGAFEILD